MKNLKKYNLKKYWYKGEELIIFHEEFNLNNLDEKESIKTIFIMRYEYNGIIDFGLNEHEIPISKLRNKNDVNSIMADIYDFCFGVYELANEYCINSIRGSYEEILEELKDINLNVYNSFLNYVNIGTIQLNNIIIV